LEFMKNHYEKIILAILLVLFVLALIYQIQIITNIGRVTPEDLAIPKKDGDYQAIDFKNENYNPTFVLNNGSKWNVREKINAKDVAATDLCIPYEIARCPHCTAFVPRYFFKGEPHKCPFCNGSLPEPPPDVDPSGLPVGEDTDNDGIPDAICKKYGWQINDPTNAIRDSSGNGFTNLFKLQNGCDLLDPKSHPPLCFRLYVDKIMRVPLGVKLKKLQERGENRSDWDIQIDVKSKKEWRTKFCKINDSVKVGNTEYKIIDCNKKQKEEFNKDTKANEIVDQSEVTIQAVNGDDKIVMVVDQPVYSPRETAIVNDVANEEKPLRLEQDKVFQMGDDKIGTEKYKVLQIDSSRKVVQLKRESDNKIFEVSSKKRFELEAVPTADAANPGAMGPGPQQPQQPTATPAKPNRRTRR